MIKTAWIACLTLVLVGCGTTLTQPKTAIVRDALPLRRSPNSILDTTRGDDATTIELLKEKVQEIVELRKRNRELEQGLKEATGLAKSESSRAEEQSRQVQRLQALLATISGEQTTLNDRVISLEIDKLQLEKKILNMKLATLAGEGN